MPIVKSLPNYIVADVNNLKAIENTPLRKISTPLRFPLAEEDRNDINTLVLKYENETGIAGLAAPQIGIAKRAIVFAIPPGIYEDTEPFPKSIWINPTYAKVNDDMEEEYEECFSVKDMIGPVNRYQSVYYKAYDMDGNKVEGVAEGMAARIIQHETDHLDGKLFIDLVPEDKLMTTNEYYAYCDSQDVDS